MAFSYNRHITNSSTGLRNLVTFLCKETHKSRQHYSAGELGVIRKMKKAYLTYKILLILAVPVLLWTSFEMYGLTIFGSQMLFYSITHAYPVIYSIVLLSLPFFFLVALYNGILILLAIIKKIAIVPLYVVGSVLSFQVLHALALYTYEYWANSGFRVLVCICGLVSLLVVSIVCFKVLGTYNKSLNQIGAKSAPPG